MTIASGQKLGRYEIRSKLGAGGMGEVYLAVDTSELGGPVAVKLLSAEVAANPKRMRRFGPLIYLKVNPIWDPLRSDPRFVERLRRVGLAP